MNVERRWKWLVGVLLVALALTVAACGATPSGTGPGGTSPAANETTPVSTAHATVAANPTTQATTSTSAQVALMPGASHYATSDSISVVVRNTSGQTIYVVAHFTDCSIISLEYLVGSNWRPVSQCADGYPHPSVTHIAPSAEVTIRLSAGMAGSNADGSVLSNWPAGTYRARLTYSTSASAAFGQGVAVYSATFSVG